jgi:hypothetical protein
MQDFWWAAMECELLKELVEVLLEIIEELSKQRTFFKARLPVDTPSHILTNTF